LVIVPGHGSVVPANEGFQWARHNKDYMNHLVEELHGSQTEMSIEDLVPPRGCRKNWFIKNVRFLMDLRYPSVL